MTDRLVLRTEGNHAYEAEWLWYRLERLYLPVVQFGSLERIKLDAVHGGGNPSDGGVRLHFSIDGSYRPSSHQPGSELPLFGLVTFVEQFDPQPSGVWYVLPEEYHSPDEAVGDAVDMSRLKLEPKPFELRVEVRPLDVVLDEVEQALSWMGNEAVFSLEYVQLHEDTISEQLQRIALQVMVDFLRRFDCTIIEAEGCFSTLANKTDVRTRVRTQRFWEIDEPPDSGRVLCDETQLTRHQEVR